MRLRDTPMQGKCLLSHFVDTVKVALGEGPWAAQEAGSLDKGLICLYFTGIVTT